MREVRLSPSKLEKFRLYIHEEYNGTITKEKVIDSITGKEKWSPQATFGAAFGAVIRYGKEKYWNPRTKTYHVQDEDMPSPVILYEEDVKHAQTFHVEHPLATYETWVWHHIYVDGIKVTFPMRCDIVEGLIIREVKTTAGSINFEMYDRSLQWRLYIDALKAEFVQYHVFKYFKPTKKIRVYRVSKPVEFKMFPYQGLKKDLVHWTRRLLEFCDINDLNDYITHERRPSIRV